MTVMKIAGALLAGAVVVADVVQDASAYLVAFVAGAVALGWIWARGMRLLHEAIQLVRRTSRAVNHLERLPEVVNRIAAVEETTGELVERVEVVELKTTDTDDALNALLRDLGVPRRTGDRRRAA